MPLSQPRALVVVAVLVTVTAARQGTPVPATAVPAVFAYVVPTVPGQDHAVSATAIPCANLWQQRGVPALGTCWGGSVAQPCFTIFPQSHTVSNAGMEQHSTVLSPRRSHRNVKRK